MARFSRVQKFSQAVGVDLPVDVRLGVVDDVVDVVALSQPVVGRQRIGVDGRDQRRRAVATFGLQRDRLRPFGRPQRARCCVPSLPWRSSRPMTATLPTIDRRL